MSYKARVGVLGTGYWGKNLLRNFNALGALSGFCDNNEAQVAAFKSSYPQAKAFKDSAALLSDSEIQAVAIATPAATHGDLVEAALMAGKHVFVEKPLCLDIDQAKRLEDLARDQKRVLMVGHLMLYHNAFRALKRFVQSGVLGPIRYIYSNRLSLGKIRREENALWSFAPHDISMILQLTGELPEKVQATGGYYLTPGIADTTLSHLTFPKGMQSHVYVSWLHPFKEQRLVVVGSDGMAVFDDTKPAQEKLLVYRHVASWNGDLPVIDKAKAEPLTFEDVEPLEQECREFLSAVEKGTKPPSDAAEGIAVLRVLAACQKSIDSGKAVDLTEV